MGTIIEKACIDVARAQVAEKAALEVLNLARLKHEAAAEYRRTTEVHLRTLIDAAIAVAR